MIISTIDVTVSKIKRDASQGEEDIMKWWTMMTADILGSLAFGEPFRMIEYEQVWKVNFPRGTRRSYESAEISVDQGH